MIDLGRIEERLTAAVSLGLLVTGVVWAGPAMAHPHAWIEARLQLIVDDTGRLTALRVGWIYDEETSAYFIEAQALDPEGDGEIPNALLQPFAGTDVRWDTPGFAGDLFVRQGRADIALGPPQDFALTAEAGLLVSSHTRPLERPRDATMAPVEVRVYDPSFWTFYTLARPLGLTAEAQCEVEVMPPDLAAAEARLQALLAGIPDGPLAEIAFPPVGEFYAEQVLLRCAESG